VRRLNLLPIACFFLLVLTWIAYPVPVAAGEKLLLAHYMPWYATKDVSGKWGYHWTMNHFDPNRFNCDGRREAASHDYPLIGLYDSGDDDALECQVLLMKFAGIDGVILDWYGTRDFHDHALIQRNIEKLIPWLKKAGLKFAVCYEDRPLGTMQQTGIDIQQQAMRDWQWAEANWFRDEAYVKEGGRPVALVFGPQHLTKDQWNEVREKLKSTPRLYGLPHAAQASGLEGVFGWPPVTGGKIARPEEWRKYLEAIEARQIAGEETIASVFPGFRDIYQQAGLHASYGSISPRDGETFAESLALAQKSSSPITQIATWNDYGEGTQVEPTCSLGYRYVEHLQQHTPAKAKYTAADLRLPVALYSLRKRAGKDAEATATLTKAAAFLFESKCAEADLLLAQVGTQIGRQGATFVEAPQETDKNYRLVTDLLYREEADATDAMKQRCRLDVYAPVGKGAFDTIVWFHGGGLTAGERSIPKPLRNQGVAVIVVNYRLMPGVKPPAFIEDAAAAVAWTMKHIGDYGGSPDRVYVSGHSAGAYLTLMLGLDKKYLNAHNIDANRIAGLIPLSSTTVTHFAIRKQRGIPETRPIVDDLAPLFHVRKDAPPLLIVTGDREKEMMGRYEENAYFWRMLKLVGHQDVVLHELGGFDHGGMAEPAFPLVLKFVRSHAPKVKAESK